MTLNPFISELHTNLLVTYFVNNFPIETIHSGSETRYRSMQAEPLRALSASLATKLQYNSNTLNKV